jgi:DNA-binding transcriptional ArsR family regulator
MIEIVLANTDLARVRFAHSSVVELVASLRVLHDPSRDFMYGTWLSSLRGQLDGPRLELLTGLVPTGRFLPDFLVSPPTEPWGVFADELDAVAATPPAIVRADLEELCDGQPLPAVLRPLHDDPPAHLPAVVQEMRRYWQVAVEPVWQRLRALSMADLSYRMERFADGGIASVFGDLHPDVAFEHDRLLIDKPQHDSHRHSLDLAGSGIVLVPCGFGWPTLIVGCCGFHQPVLIYPPRGVAELWEESRVEQTDPLSALMGRTRATLLARLDLPRTTTQLAVQLDLSPAAVSQHLRILKDTALVTARRSGRLVLYQRTAAATGLLAAIRSGEAAG